LFADVEFLNVTTGATQSNHWASKCLKEMSRAAVL